MEYGHGPVEYSLAVEKYLDAADLTPASRRVYRIALHTWGWLLVDRLAPTGAERRGAASPVVPLARLDGPDAPARLRAARDRRAAAVDPRTLNRELSILRGAISWWSARGWLDQDRGADLVPAAFTPAAGPESALDPASVEAIFALRATLRDQTLWQLLFETAAPIERLLFLDIADLDLARRTTRRRSSAPAPASAQPQLSWRAGAARLLPLLLAGRYSGPIFLTDRRAPAATPAADRCPTTGRARLSYRRAAELFQAATIPLDPAGHGWSLRRLRLAGKLEIHSRPT